MKRTILLVGSIIIVVLATVAFAKQRSTRSNDTDKIAWEYLVIAGGRNNLSSAGTNGKLAKLALESGFREYYPLELNLDKLGAEGRTAPCTEPCATAPGGAGGSSVAHSAVRASRV